nr:NlpC/P60 family protein [uncultured Corynebacterium sp.]
MAGNASRRPFSRMGTGLVGRSFRAGAISRVLIVVAVSGSMVAGLAPATAQPSNPDDASIAQAQATVEAGNGEVSRLAGSLSETDAEISKLELEMGGLREAVNKALVDLHDAQAEAEHARQNAVAAKADLEDSQAQIEAAQERLNEISRAAYRQNGTSKGLAGISGNGNTEDALDRQTYLRTTAERQRLAVEELDRLRTENANKESALREARIIAEQREAEAIEQERLTQAAIAENSEQLGALTTSRTNLVAQRQEAERNLAAARSDVENLQGQRAEFEEFQRAEAERERAEAEAAAAAEEKRKADEAAARAAAESEAAAAQAAQEAAAQQEAVTREQARQQAEEAKAAAQQAQEAAAVAAADDAEAQALRDQALAAASVAAAALIAASQADHATTENPYPSGEEAEAGDVAAVQVPQPSPEQEAPAAPEEQEQVAPVAPVVPEVEPADDLWAEDDYVALEEPELELPVEVAPSEEATADAPVDLGDLTDSASEIVSGDRSAKIEAVISRASAMIGTPYAWGGGNATGPTKGIRDGGVADSYGDYNKVGFDCSGLVLYAFAGVGIALPHYTGYQYQHGTKVSTSEMQRGDLIFYGPGASQHVAIYLGDGQMLEAPSSGSTVQISPVRWSGMTEYAVRLI